MFSTPTFKLGTSVVGVTLLMLFTAFQVYPRASAAFSACQGDPDFVLSNGKVKTVTTSIGTNSSSVKAIRYVVHLPPGVYFVSVSWSTDLGLLGKEHLTVYEDAQPNQYIADTLVQTTTNRVSVTATTTVNIASQSRSGFNGQHLTATLLVP